MRYEMDSQGRIADELIILTALDGALVAEMWWCITNIIK